MVGSFIANNLISLMGVHNLTALVERSKISVPCAFEVGKQRAEHGIVVDGHGFFFNIIGAKYVF